MFTLFLIINGKKMYFYNACFFSGPNEDEMKETGFELR